MNDYITIALTKGRLADQTMQLLEKAGYYCEELRDKKSRKLIFVNEEQKLRFFLAKGPDVPTYVEYGAAARPRAESGQDAEKILPARLFLRSFSKSAQIRG